MKNQNTINMSTHWNKEELFSLEANLVKNKKKIVTIEKKQEDQMRSRKKKMKMEKQIWPCLSNKERKTVLPFLHERKSSFGGDRMLSLRGA